MPKLITAMMNCTHRDIWRCPAAQDRAPLPSRPRHPLKLEAKIPLGKYTGESITWRLIWPGSVFSLPSLATPPSGSSTSTGAEVIRPSRPREPQGLAYSPFHGYALYRNGGDGSVRIIAGADYAAAGQIDLGEDADNIGLDGPANQIRGRIWQRRPRRDRRIDSPEDRRHSVAGPPRRFST